MNIAELIKELQRLRGKSRNDFDVFIFDPVTNCEYMIADLLMLKTKVGDYDPDLYIVTKDIKADARERVETKE